MPSSRNDAPRGIEGKVGKRGDLRMKKGERKRKTPRIRREDPQISREKRKAGQLKNKLKEVRPFGRKQWWSLVTRV
jgi:hypothetical protein